MATFTSGTTSTSWASFVTGPGNITSPFSPSSDLTGGVTSPNGNVYYYVTGVAVNVRGYDGTSSISFICGTSAGGSTVDSTSVGSVGTSAYSLLTGTTAFVVRNGVTYHAGPSTGSQGGMYSTRTNSTSGGGVYHNGSLQTGLTNGSTSDTYFRLTYVPLPNTAGTIGGFSSTTTSISYSVPTTGSATGYRVQYSTDQVNWSVANVSAGANSISGLTPNTPYYFRHAAYNGAYSLNSAYTGPYSSVTNFQTQPDVLKPVIQYGFITTGTVNVFYSDSAFASNTPTSWAYQGTLPPGLNFSSSGSSAFLSGTPTTAGFYNFTFTASNAGGTSDAWNQSITIAAPPDPTWDSYAAFANGKVNQAYYQTRTTSNSVSLSSLSTNAPGLSATASGTTLVLSGTPTVSGSYSVSGTVNGQAGTNPDYLNTTVFIAPLAPPTWVDQTVSTTFVVGTAYSDTVSADNATSYLVSAGSLPSGITLSSASGVVSGTPTAKQTFSFQLQASNTDGNITTQTFSGTTSAPPRWVDESLADFFQGRAYSDAVSATSLTTPGTTYSVTAGALPTGIVLSSTTGTVTGTPTGSGSYTFTITATNPDGNISKEFTGAVKLPPNWVENVLGSFVENLPYVDSVTATNSPTYEVSVGALPTGISLDANTGVVSGSATVLGESYSFTIRAYNIDGQVTQSYSGTVQPDLGGGLKVYDGTVWGNKTVYVFDGTNWVEGKVHLFNGSIWTKSLF